MADSSAEEVQFTGWKARRLACCRGSLRIGCALLSYAPTAWRYGLRLGLDCARCCANLMVLLLVLGVMDLRAMAVVAAAITLERLAPTGQRAERVLGAVLVGFGLFMLV
jgi:predicted metal-binding membrane protein